VKVPNGPATSRPRGRPIHQSTDQPHPVDVTFDCDIRHNIISELSSLPHSQRDDATRGRDIDQHQATPISHYAGLFPVWRIFLVTRELAKISASRLSFVPEGLQRDPCVSSRREACPK